jgi:ATP-dependent DNA ligase
MYFFSSNGFLQVEVCVFVFDIMFVNGEQLLALPLRERRRRLKEVFPETRPGYLEYAKEITVSATVVSHLEVIGYSLLLYLSVLVFSLN